jgi:hypothetical protein
MKKQLPLILTLVTGAGLFFWLKRKKAAGMNLRYEPIDIAIDSQRSAASLFSRIYYNLKLRLINNESANVNIRAINLQAFLKVADRQPRKIGDIVNNTGFQVLAKGQKEIKLDTSISTGGVIQIIKDLLLEGINFQINVNGFVDTDLGRLDINFTKDFESGRITGVFGNDKPKNYLKNLIDIRKGSYRNNTKGYETLMHFRETDPYKLLTHPKIISYNTKNDTFNVR